MAGKKVRGRTGSGSTSAATLQHKDTHDEARAHVAQRMSEIRLGHVMRTSSSSLLLLLLEEEAGGAMQEGDSMEICRRRCMQVIDGSSAFQAATARNSRRR